jgi:predicted RNase H-like nuclease (RuvC/YqgF family)
VNKAEVLEGKIRQVVERLGALRKENERLRSECESLKSQVAMLTHENNKAARMVMDYQQLRRAHEQATQRVERALQKLAAISTN